MNGLHDGNIDKCKSLHIRRNNMRHCYEMEGKKLEQVTEEKGLGMEGKKLEQVTEEKGWEWKGRN